MFDVQPHVTAAILSSMVFWKRSEVNFDELQFIVNVSFQPGQV